MHSKTGEALEDKEISGESGDDGESKSTTHENHDHNDKHETSKISVNVSSGSCVKHNTKTGW